MSFVKEFREFAMKGSVIDLAVGVIIGGAFQKIVDSVVGDLLMPLLGKVSGGVSFKDMYLPLAGQDAQMPLADAQKAGAVLAYGHFIDVFIQFLLMAFAVFLMIKAINKLRRPEPAPAEAPADVALLTEIRDLLKK
jgi:large conductance mechanosensitive channel